MRAEALNKDVRGKEEEQKRLKEPTVCVCGLFVCTGRSTHAQKYHTTHLERRTILSDLPLNTVNFLKATKRIINHFSNYELAEHF